MKEDLTASLYLENQLCFPLYAASRLTTKVYAPYLEKMDITYPQYLVLLVLWQHQEQSVKEIGERLFLESNTLTPLLKRLEQKKLIKRARSKSDERTVLITLTNEGKELKNEAISIPHRIVESFQDESIDAEEVMNFQKTLFKLLGILSEKSSH
ncbi:MarR family winged helix-turn-helix transcriptional regulator [Algoriphagus machipongonensis]|uniref:HTH-type transcriptional regulator SarZ n=1 Tax=Algoriphagus machipongonensis TaxID=388413 RepID=A3HYP6_9BACT|nr:MarR family transcriptional regulator [Algoriphagus machipongonensis]EAZ80382.1 transcriptional regulator, MarR family [Algoriphagus machipongonensis]